MMNKLRSAVGSAFNRGDQSSTSSCDSAYKYASRDLLPFHKYSYSRPDFLDIAVEEYSIVLDKNERPIVVPRNLSCVPGFAGYAETVNGGKSKLNEDQAQTFLMLLHGSTDPRLNAPSVMASMEDYLIVSQPDSDRPNNTDCLNSCQEMQTFQKNVCSPLVTAYFGLFDGHAGPGAALFARHMLHLHIKEKLHEVLPLIHHLNQLENQQQQQPAAGIADSGDHRHQQQQRQLVEDVAGFSAEDCTTVCRASLDDLVCGALEDAFLSLDSQLERELDSYMISGGCTALVVLGLLGRIYVANAGDCRAVLIRGGVAIPMSNDFTPHADRERILTIAKHAPHLLGGEFSHLDFNKRINRRDIGKRVFYRHSSMQGWATKIATEEDLKFPLIYGEGKRARLMQTIGVARGFGDFTLCFYNTSIHVKPFMTATPEVRIFNPTAPSERPSDFNSRTAFDDMVVYQRVADVENNSVDAASTPSSSSPLDESDTDLATTPNENPDSDKPTEEDAAGAPTQPPVPEKESDETGKRASCSSETAQHGGEEAPCISPLEQADSETSANDVLIMGSDGLWDVCSIDHATRIVTKSLTNSKSSDTSRFTIAAQELVMYARGIFQQNNWVRREGLQASVDDITVFVIPLTLLLDPPMPS